MTTAEMCPGCRSALPSEAEICPTCGELLAPEDAPTRPSSAEASSALQIGDYRLEERIGVGGMGYVYRAVHGLLGNAVAIKVLRPDVISSSADLHKFLGEAKALNQVRHPGVVSIFGGGETPDGRKYLVMELFEGESLEARRVQHGKLSSMEALPLLEQVLAALAAVHAAGMVHRDLKPANVFLAKQSDGSSVVKLLDFGLARRSNLEQVSRIAGTPDYISPEHARGQVAGPPADFYAFGVMAFQLVTGRLPFIGANAVEVIAKHVRDVPPDPGVLDGSIPPALCALVLALLRKDAAARPAAAQIRAELKAAAAQLRSAATQRVGAVTMESERQTVRVPEVVPLGPESETLDDGEYASLASPATPSTLPPAESTTPAVWPESGGRDRPTRISARRPGVARGPGPLPGGISSRAVLIGGAVFLAVLLLLALLGAQCGRAPERPPPRDAARGLRH